MATVQPLVSQFTLTGKLEDLVTKSGDCIKYLQLISEQEEYWIKVAKELRNNFSRKLQPGYLLKVTGMRRYEIHKGKVKYKAYGIEVLEKPVITENSNVEVATKPKAKVLFCQKSTCWKKGGKTACALLKAELESNPLKYMVCS